MSKEEKKEQFLRFGQIIRIHGHKCIHMDKEEEEPRGMIAVKGFTDKDAKYITFTTFKDCEFYRKCLFQLLPKGQFDKTDNEMLEKRKLKEFQNLVKSKMGQYVKYGEDVVFKHVDSHDYLSGSVRCSDGGLGAFKVQLSTDLSPDLVFKLDPFRSFEKEGDKIKLQSPLRIKNISNRCYISTEKNTEKKYNIVTTYSKNFTWLIHLHEAHDTLEDLQKIRTHDIIFLIHTKNDGYLCKEMKENPCIKLPLRNTDYPLYTSLWEIQKLAVPQISPYNQTEDKQLGTEGTYTLRQLLTGEYLEVDKLSINSLQNVANNNKIDSKEITIKSAKGLPNIDDYLRDKGLIKIGGPKNSIEGEIDAGQFRFLDQELLEYREKHPFEISQIKLSDADSQNGFRIQKIDEQSKDQVLFILSTYQVLEDFCQILSQDTVSFEANVKSNKLQMIDLTLQKLVAFIKDCPLSEIEGEILPVKKLQFVCMDLQICNKLFIILKQIGIKFLEEIYKKLKGENDALKTVFNRAYYIVWQIIKDNPITKLYVCESWLWIILDHAIQNQEDTVHATLNQILQMNDEVVTKFLKANNNQLVQRINDVFILKPPHEKFLNIFSASCVSGSLPIVGNQNLILNQFINQLDEKSTFKFRYELEHQPEQIGNQLQNSQEIRKKKIKKIYIQCYISKDHKDQRKLNVFFDDSGRIDLYQTSNYFIAYLNLLADVCYGKNTQAKKYVESNLVPTKRTEMMAEQNFDQLERQDQSPSSLDALIAILQDKDMTPQVKGCINLQRAVLRLITYAYVQSADMNPVLRINRYRNLDVMENEIIYKDIKFKSIMSFIKEVLHKFNSFYSVIIADKDPDRKIKQQTSNQSKMRLYTILNLLKSTLINGMWTVKEQQYQILPLLFNILKNQKADILHQRQDCDTMNKEIAQFNKFKNQVSKATPGVKLIVQCKALACELIEIIFDFRFNNLVTETVAFYKDLEQQKKQNIKQLHKIALDLANIKSDAETHLLYNSELWQQKLTKIVEANDGPDSEKVKSAIKMLIPLMVELSIHKAPQLFSRSLIILQRHFYSTSDIKNLLLSLSLYEKGNGEYLARKISEKRRSLNKLEEESLLYSKDGSHPYNEIMNFLVWLSQSIKIGTSQEGSLNFQNFNCIFDHFHQGSRIDKFHQRLIKNMDLHKIMLKFLSLSKQSLSTFSTDAKLVLKYVYRFLTLLCKNSKEAKSQMIEVTAKIINHAQQECTMIKQMIKKRQEGSLEAEELFDMENLVSIGLLGEQHLKMLNKRYDCEAILLLAELFNDNKQFLYNQSYMETTTILFSEMVDEVPIKNNYYKAHVLDFLRSMIYYKDKHIIVNQSRILAKLQDFKKKNIYYRFDKKDMNGSDQDQLIPNLIGEWKIQNEELLTIQEPSEPYPLRKGEEKPVIILPQLTYFITMMNLLANLVEGKQTVNIGKCRQVHDYTMLMTILQSSSICYPLKTHLRNYINELYYSTTIEEDLCADIVKIQIPLLIEDLNTLIVILSKERQNSTYYIIHPIRYKFFESYIYLYIEQICYSINYLINDENFVREIRKQLDTNYARYYFYLHYFILRIYERLRWILNYYYLHRYIRGFLNKITNKLKDIFLIYFRDNAYIVFDKSQEKLHSFQQYQPEGISPNKKKAMSQNRVLALKKRCKKLLHKLVEAQIGNYFTEERPQKNKNFPLTFFLPYDDDAEPGNQKEQNSNEKEEREYKIAQKLRIMLFGGKEESKKRADYHSLTLSKLDKSLHEKASFRLFMANFIFYECQELYNIDQHSQSHYKFTAKFVSFEEYISIFVKVNTNNPSEISSQLKIFFFNILLQFIVRHKVNDRLKPVETWTKHDWEPFKDQVQASQIFLKKANISELLIETLKKTQDLNLILIILQFGIAYLLGGNTECQNSILQKLKADKKNELFLKLNKIISKLGKKISTKIAEFTAKVEPQADQFTVQPIDRYDYFDAKTKAVRRFGAYEEEDDQKKQQSLEKNVFGCLFKFLQLLCECNNFEFKNFVREQIDTDGTKKNASFNILSMTTFEIRRLFKVMNEDASIIILPLTDFLNEVVTLPCKHNQISLCETTFFEDLCYMASFFKDSEKENLKERGFDKIESAARLFQLYQKCILVILNILEGNDARLNSTFLVKLDVNFLLGIIQKNFKILNIKTKEQLYQLLHCPVKQEIRVPVALENAMNVMVVLLKLEESQNSEGFKDKKRAYLIQSEKGRGLNLAALLDTLKEEILKIEIVSDEGKQYIYFPNHPILTKLSGATRNRIMAEVSRSTQREKIKTLLQFKDQVFAEINHNFKIQKQKYMEIQISPAKILQLQDYLFKLSYFINFLWIYTTDVSIEYFEVQYYIPSNFGPIIKILDSIQLIITTIYFILYFKCKFQLAQFRSDKNKDLIKQEEQRKKALNNPDEEDEVERKEIQIPPPKNGVLAGFTYVLEKVSSIAASNSFVILSKNDEKFSYTLVFLLTSIAGTFLSQKIFILYFLYYFMLNETLENVFKAITYNIKQLLSVSLLGGVFIYVFCLIFYQIYALDLMADKESNARCDTIFYCILDLYVSGSIGGSVEEFKISRFFTDLVYFIFFGLLFSNIVSSIMIDTFAQRRALRIEMMNDKKNKCYICGRDRGELQKEGEQFDNHIKQKHFLWNYIYYLYCLENKSQTEYTGLEYYIRECINKGENQEDYIRWIPFGGEEADPNSQKIKELTTIMKELNTQSKDKISILQKQSGGKIQELVEE